MPVCLHSPLGFIGHLMLSKHDDMPVKIILGHLYAYGAVSAWMPKSLYNRCQTWWTESKSSACAATELPIISLIIVFSSNYLYQPCMHKLHYLHKQNKSHMPFDFEMSRKTCNNTPFLKYANAKRIFHLFQSKYFPEYNFHYCQSDYFCSITTRPNEAFILYNLHINLSN